MNVSNLLSKTAQATLLLTSYFSKATSENAKPLSNAEWGRFALWLKEKAVTPADLLDSDPQTLLNGWYDSRISTDRIIELMNRGHSLALAMEKWQRAGLWVVTRSDPEYPWRLKHRLKTDSPPVLFGCGNKTLLNRGGLAVIGSRNANASDLTFTDHIGVKAADENIAVVSGAARGVDETAMLGAMRQGGVVIGILADSLLKAATSAKWRKGLMNDHVVLISPFYPEAGFYAGNAMARNKYIYCLSDSALVIHSGRKGGTISGAEENLKKGWVPLWVNQTTDLDSANADLVSKGGHWLPSDSNGLSIENLLKNNDRSKMQLKAEPQDLFSELSHPELIIGSAEKSSTQALEKDWTATINEETPNLITTGKKLEEKELDVNPIDFYLLFRTELQRLAEHPITVDRLTEVTGLNKSQVLDWLKRAEQDGLVKKINRPTRYQLNE
ncbi:DNA-processing protein DprA [Klebsiella quasipneumoniae]|uniref:DNA-processing protein DprA n=1 Tax=Klebsiella quasipneumoniae TaxID=1463165 RepID=UPI0010332AE5|nr:DNA-processing protein DprA [Klebsiella quasipneumoniae]HBW1749980.1 DNA-processing protein DprA [Klebsiella quasipneumoniae subsp. similipneumoniae]EIY4988664.1 DNA-protecting protein DprA [Klebsiella quasipneumoniae]EIY5010494.1 DNA-protecting protein DprA [Klebsiella quasipneumoniae]EIY5074075.1 DNA-protecting protein DprA [Klebsiella quasipneumoniae]ELA0825462.1 DNA-protecting protein DprA [Klebsiella quasipneumoniae]